MQRRNTSVARGPFHVTQVFAASARGATITDVDGNQFIDLAAGIGVSNIGHCNQKIVAAIKAQADRFIHTGFNVVPYEGYIAVCEKLNALAPGDFPKKSFLANTGAEAVENAIKIARVFTGRKAVACFEHAFHGRTYMSMALTSKSVPYKEGFGPFDANVFRLPFPDPYRSTSGEITDSFSAQSFDRFSQSLESQINPGELAAIILEPVLGEGGFMPVPFEFWRQLRQYCDQHDILMIADEVQTGFLRTGTVFASSQFPGAPDLITLAKGLGGGMPVSAVVGRADVMDAPAIGGIGGTYNGNPLACASALVVLDTVTNDEVVKHANKLGEILIDTLGRWEQQLPAIGNVRGLGPMQAIELVTDRTSKTPNPALTKKVMERAIARGVVLMSAGTHGNVIRFLPPLTISEEELISALDTVRDILFELGDAQP